MFKIYRTAVLLTLLCVQCIDAFGQEISVKSHIRELPTDLTARKYEKTDAQGNACAVIKVELPSLPDIFFSNSVGDVKQNAGEYVLYVSPGITSIDVMRGKNLVCTIDMEGVEIEAKHTYQVVLALKREKVFRVIPENAEIVVNGEKIEVDSTGIGRMNCEVGVMYNYTITAPGYENISDNFMIAPEEAQVALISKRLNRKTRNVKFDCKTKHINVFAGVERIDKESDGTYKIPLGEQKIRITSEDYEDWTDEVFVSEGEWVMTIFADLQKPKNGVSKSLRTRYEIYAAGGGFFTTMSSEKEDECSVSDMAFNFGFSPEFFLTRWVTFRPGIEMAILGDRHWDFYDYDEYSLMDFSIPLVLSLNLPLGKYNQHHFSVGAGPILGVGLLLGTIETENKDDLDKIDAVADFLLGLRISAQLTFSHFIIGANLDYQKYMSGKIYKKAMIMPMATIGYKF